MACIPQTSLSFTGIEIETSSVEKIIVAAEPLSPAKREKLEREWGAEVFDHFGMTEAAFVAGETATRGPSCLVRPFFSGSRR